MPVYQYQGQHFDLPDGLSNEDAIGKIKKHLGQGTDTPKENPFMDVAPAAVSMVAGLPSQIWGGLRGLHDLASGKGLDAAANRVKHEQESNFGFGEFKAPTEEGQRYIDKLQETMAMPGQLAGRGAEKLGLDPIYGQLPVDAAMNFIAPAHIAAGAGGMLKRAVGKAPEAPRAPVDVSVLKEPEAAPAARIPEQMELPLETTAQQIAERRGAEVGQRDLFGPINEELGRPDMGEPITGPTIRQMEMEAVRLRAEEAAAQRYGDAQAVMEARQKQMELEVKRQTLLDQGAAERGRQGQAPVPGLEESRAREVNQSIARTQELNQRGGQMEIDATPEGYMANQYGGGQDGLRIDENGMPIRADRSMEAANLENPLQRNLWGDELPRQSAQEAPRGITAAIDRMPPGEARQAGIDMLTGNRPTLKEATGNLLSVIAEGTGAKLNMMEGGKLAPALKDFAHALFDAGHTTLAKAMRMGQEAAGASWGRVVGAFKTAWKNAFAERAGIDLKWLETSTNATKNLKGGIRLVMRGGEDGPSVHAFRGETEIGNLKLMVNDFANPTTHSKLVPGFVTVDQANRRQGIAKEMYLFAREQGNTVIPSSAQTGQGQKMSASFQKQGIYGGPLKAQRNIPRGQRGGIDLKAIEEGIKRMAGQVSSATSKTLPLVAKVPPANSMETPTLPATILKKNELREKTQASSLLRQIAPEYDSVTTVQEATTLAKDAKDINANPVRDATISGINGLTMLKRDNPVLNFARYALQTYRNAATKFSKDFITSPDGVATTYAKLKGQDRVQAVEVLREAAAAQIEITPENIKKLGLKPAQEAYILSVRKMLDAQWAMAADSLQMAGRTPFEKRAGYLPSLFTGSYKSLIGEMKNGVFTTREIVQADTRWGHKAAVDAALKANPGHVVRELPRTGLKQMGRSSNLFNGFNDIMNVIAKHDPRFAELQMAAQMKINEANHGLMNFDVHELNKKGIRGAVGDSRVLSREKNAAELGKAIIDFGEQGADYYASQKALNDIGEVITSPDVAHMPNTIAVVADHLKHVTGQNLNPLGNALNWGIDGLFKAVGVSPKVPLAAARGFKTAMGIHMMGIYNPTFTALQLTQLVTGALPESLKVGSKLGVDITTSATTAPLALSMLKYGKAAGVEVPVAPHMRAAFQYAQDHGIMDFSELEIAHKATRNKNINRVEAVGAFPISLGEKLTRPPVFMTFADMFHKFGLADSEAFMAAQHATNMAMGDYHPNERPKIYQALGLVGEFGGALTTFKHNAITNLALRGKDAVYKDSGGKRMITPALAAIAAASLFQGISGMPGFDEMDAMYQWATNQMGKRQGITETALKQVPDWGKYGYLSSSSGLDFHSRMSMSRALPEMTGAALSPQLAALADIGLKAYAYGKFKDEQSYKDFVRSITPSVLKGAMEDKMLTDDKGFVSNPAGELMNEQPRNANERMWRKFAAVKPLRESVEQKDVYIDAKSIKEREEAQKVISQRFRQAFAAGDQKGMDSLAQMYYDKEGDPSVLWNDTALQNQIIRSNQSQRDRMTGQLQATMKSINRYRDMNDGK